jgi:glycosyltransferase involved in cell wall biosynthesis
MTDSTSESQAHLDISVVIIALNEERNIERILKSVSWAREVLVYDSGSTDQTVQIAEKMGAKVICGPWLGFGTTKKNATALARYDWVLSVDADEEVSTELRMEIEKKFSGFRNECVYRLPRRSFYLGRWIDYGGWYPDYQGRLFNKQYSQWTEQAVHEKVIAQSTESLDSHLNHYVFRDISHQVITNDRYSTLQAQELFKSGRRFSWFHFLTKPTVKFIECYLWKRGFLDGWAGYLIARSAAYSVLLKWAKLYELQQGFLPPADGKKK